MLYHGGLSNDLSHYEICTRIENVELPKTGHFGVSAATGGLADDHDVLAFITHTYIDHKNFVKLKFINIISIINKNQLFNLKMIESK